MTKKHKQLKKEAVKAQGKLINARGKKKCRGASRHASKEDANVARFILAKKINLNPLFIKCYKCTTCKHWHVGRSLNSTEKIQFISDKLNNRDSIYTYKRHKM